METVGVLNRNTFSVVWVDEQEEWIRREQVWILLYQRFALKEKRDTFSGEVLKKCCELLQHVSI